MVFKDWDARLEACETSDEVVRVAQDFLDSLDSFEVAVLPLACRPRQLTSADQVNLYAFDLLAIESPEDAGSHVVKKVAIFFAQAANRLARLHSPRRNFTDEELGLTKPPG